MREQIKELCIFMICGQTLLHFQSGKKYEKICRMILELLVLAGIVGMILNFLQTLGIQKGDMPAAGGAVANMQRSIEEALLKQLDMDGADEGLMPGISMENLVEKYTMEEIRLRYGHFAGQYGFEIDRVEQKEDTWQIFVKRADDFYETAKADGQTEGEEAAGAEMEGEGGERAAGAEDLAETEKIRRVEIEKVDVGDMGTKEKTVTEEEAAGWESGENMEAVEDRLLVFRRQLALVFAVEEEKLEVILID